MLGIITYFNCICAVKQKPLAGYEYLIRKPWGEVSTFAELFLNNLFVHDVGSKIFLAKCIFRRTK